jgi:hypothetical protein
VEIKWIVSPEEMETRQNYAIYKYVIFEDGEILFCEVQKQHADIISRTKLFGHDHGKPLSAGKIVVDLWRGKRWNHIEIGSHTLNLKGSWEEDRLALQKKLEKFTFDYELHG